MSNPSKVGLSQPSVTFEDQGSQNSDSTSGSLQGLSPGNKLVGCRRVMSHDQYCMIEYEDSKGLIRVCGWPVNRCGRKCKNDARHSGVCKKGGDSVNPRGPEGSYVILPPIRSTSIYLDGDRSSFMTGAAHAASLEQAVFENRAAAQAMSVASPATMHNYSEEQWT